MRRATTIGQELTQLHTIQDLTEVFESVASMHIAKIRSRVIASKQFFAELWPTYRSLRIDPRERVASGRQSNNRSALIALTTGGKLGGETDETIADSLTAAITNPEQTDIMAIGSRGATLLKQRGINVRTIFDLPPSDINLSVGDIIKNLQPYKRITVFYQTYESLRVQKVARIELLTAVRALGEDIAEEGETVSSRDYIFEPNITQIADYMESVMMSIALTQIIMESKLAGYAARFNAMNRAKHRAKDMVDDFRLQYYRARRNEGDERLKEMMKVVKISRRLGASQ